MSAPTYRVIDWAEYPRRAHFTYFSSFGNPYVSVTVNKDITALRARVKRDQLPFFLTVLYALDRAANAVPAFRQRGRDGQIIEYARCTPSYTVALPDGTYCYATADTDQPFAAYLIDAKARQKASIEHPSLDEPDSLPLFFVSSVPWFSFTALSLPTPSPADYNPRLTIGKFFSVDDRILLPVSVTANHALVDGLHIAAFYDAFDREAKALGEG